MKKLSLANFVIKVILIIGAIFSLFPFYWMIVMASRTNSEIFAIPPHFTLGSHLIENINIVFTQTNFFQAFLNTLFYAVVATTLVLFFDSLAGYTFAKMKFKGKKFLFVALLATMMIPGQINIIPQFIMMDYFGWVGSYKALIVPGMANAFGIFWIKQYCENAIPDSIIEAATIDGSGKFGTYWRIGIPILKPAMSFLAIYTFIGAWNDYTWPLIILNDETKYVISLALTRLQGLYFTNYPLVITGTLISVIPVLILFVFFSRQLMSGITDGAVKE
ncbi:carbohydrate ABC transporter permease [Bacillus salipaludis]|uniref:Carbohydrate ABC transporter permease n=1 Tax=Bacillus salipaludis TaxID=2547811 RepID=A0ABW8REH5_9BACI